MGAEDSRSWASVLAVRTAEVQQPWVMGCIGPPEGAADRAEDTDICRRRTTLNPVWSRLSAGASVADGAAAMPQSSGSCVDSGHATLRGLCGWNTATPHKICPVQGLGI